MHLGDPDVGMLPAIAIVGGGNTVVTGLGLAFKLRRTGQVAACFFGEGATNEGAIHEGLNFAAVQRLPVVFVCENNLYGASTPWERVSLVPSVATRAGAYGVMAQVVDGMDVVAVRQATSAAIAAARAGEGPTLLECGTYRFVGHSRSDALQFFLSQSCKKTRRYSCASGAASRKKSRFSSFNRSAEWVQLYEPVNTALRSSTANFWCIKPVSLSPVPERGAATRRSGTFCPSRNFPFERSLPASKSRSMTTRTERPRLLACTKAAAKSSLVKA